eukprot:403363885
MQQLSTIDSQSTNEQFETQILATMSDIEILAEKNLKSLKSINQRNIESEEQEIQFLVNPFIEKIFFTENEKIVAYEFITIKPLGKSPNGHIINQALAIALESGIVRVYDIFGNKLFEFLVADAPTNENSQPIGKEILQIQASPMVDDMFIGVLTKDNQFYIYDILLERTFQYQRDKYQEVQQNQNKTQKQPLNQSDQHHSHELGERYLKDESLPSSDNIASISQFDEQTGELKTKPKNKQDLRKKKKQNLEDDSQAKYKSLLKIYNYRTDEPPKVINLDSLLTQHGYPQYLEPQNSFKEFLIYVSKGEKFFIFIDSYGYFTILKRDGAFRSRFPSGSKDINNLAKLSVNVIYSTDQKIGFVKFLDSSAGSIMCDAGRNYELIGAELDQTLAGIIYAGTKEGEILVFESHSIVHRLDAIECKIIGRLQTNIQQQMISQNKTMHYDFKAIKGSLIIFSEDGQFEQINTTDIYQLITNPPAHNVMPFSYKPKNLQNSGHFFSSQDNVKVAEARISHANILAVKVPGRDNQIVLYECLAPQVKHESIFDNFNFKFPMFMVAFLLVVGYQFYKRKSSNNSYETEEESSLLGKFSKNKNLSAKAKKDLMEIEKMMGSLGDLGKSVGKMTGSGIKPQR